MDGESGKKISLQDNPLVNGKNVAVKMIKIENLSSCMPITSDAFVILLGELKSLR